MRGEEERGRVDMKRSVERKRGGTSGWTWREGEREGGGGETVEGRDRETKRGGEVSHERFLLNQFVANIRQQIHSFNYSERDVTPGGSR